MRCPCCYIYPREVYSEKNLYPLTITREVYKKIEPKKKSKKNKKEATSGTEEPRQQLVEVQEILFCSKKDCALPAYFFCNRNICSRNECQQESKLKLFTGCGEPVCYKHFKVEFYIDYERNE